jgi:hypothetical protein
MTKINLSRVDALMTSVIVAKNAPSIQQIDHQKGGA